MAEADLRHTRSSFTGQKKKTADERFLFFCCLFLLVLHKFPLINEMTALEIYSVKNIKTFLSVSYTLNLHSTGVLELPGYD